MVGWWCVAVGGGLGCAQLLAGRAGVITPKQQLFPPAAHEATVIWSETSFHSSKPVSTLCNPPTQAKSRPASLTSSYYDVGVFGCSTIRQADLLCYKHTYGTIYAISPTPLRTLTFCAARHLLFGVRAAEQLGVCHNYLNQRAPGPSSTFFPGAARRNDASLGSLIPC